MKKKIKTIRKKYKIPSQGRETEDDVGTVEIWDEIGMSFSYPTSWIRQVCRYIQKIDIYHPETRSSSGTHTHARARAQNGKLTIPSSDRDRFRLEGLDHEGAKQVRDV